jgi:hypothetical protein
VGAGGGPVGPDRAADGKLRIVADPPLVVPIDDLIVSGTPSDEVEKFMRSLIQKYRRSLADHHRPIEEFEYVHSARKVVGVGSVGTRAWIHLFVGRGAEVESLLVPGATAYARLCGATLARAHARWGDRIAIASYLGKGNAFDRAIADFSAAYADQNERDFEAFAEVVNAERLKARTGL